MVAYIVSAYIFAFLCNGLMMGHIQARNSPTLQDFMDFLKRARWKLTCSKKRERQCGHLPDGHG